MSIRAYFWANPESEQSNIKQLMAIILFIYFCDFIISDANITARLNHPPFIHII